MIFLMLSVTKKANKYGSKNRNELLVTFKGVKYGAFAGFVATWSISSVIVVTELLLGLNIGAFYSIMGISLGINDVTAAASIAFGLHLIVGTIIGAVFGARDQVEKNSYAQSVQILPSWHGRRYYTMASFVSANNFIPSATSY